MNFLRNLLAAIIGSLIAFAILFIMFMIFVGLVSSAEDGMVIRENSILELQLQQPINDYVGDNEADPFAGFFGQAQGLDEILHAIKVAKNDDNIKAISINNSFMMAGMAQTQAIRKELAGFKQSGKLIYAFADYYMQKDYYLSSVADKVYLNPVGGMDFRGLSTEVLFYKDLQEKTGVKMEVIRHGKYKSAVEPFLANEMSDANRTQIKELLESIWGAMISEISEGRKISEENLNIIADTLGGRLPKHAKKAGLVDDLLFLDEYEAKLKEAVGLSPQVDLELISLQEYARFANKKKINKGKDKIAVIFAQGEILYGEGDQNIIGQGIITKAIIKARNDAAVKAIVLRVNSPGGSALTSDIIWREIELAKEKKPVVVSMGNVAASGGYYIAVGADKIFAEPTTITGSIGVFGTVPNIHGLAADIGVNAEQVGTNENSVEYSLFEPMTTGFRSVVKEGVEQVYDTFLERVAAGRNITVEKADSLAQGRVWSGVDAKKIGLIDELGTLDDAIAAAAKLAEMSDFGVRKYPKYKTGLEKFMEDMGGIKANIGKKWMKEELGNEAYRLLQQMKLTVQQKGIYTRMPYLLEIK